MKLINAFFEYTGIILIFINALLYLIGYRHHRKTIAYKYFCWYLVLSCIIALSAFIMASTKTPNLHLSHFYFVNQFIFLSLFYKSLFKTHQKKYVTYTLILVLLILGFQYSLNPNLFYQFNSFEIFFTSLPLVIYSIVHLYNSLNHTYNYSLINAGVLVYIASSTLIFILGNYLSELDFSYQIRNIYLINKILYVVYLTLILIQWKTNFQQGKRKS